VRAVAAIAEADINQYVEDLGLNMTFEFVVFSNYADGGAAVYNTMVYKLTGIDLIVGHPWSGQCLASLNFVNTNNMLLISGSSTSPSLAIPNDRLFRTSPHSGVMVTPLAEMWKTWGVDAVLTMQLSSWRDFPSDDFEYELGIRNITSLGRIMYHRDSDEWDNDYEEKLEEANETITEAIEDFGVDRVGIQFFSWDEIVQLQTEAADYPNLIDVIWMTADEMPRSQRGMLDEAGELATQTRHFSPLFAVNETSTLYLEFFEKYYNLTEEPHGYYTAMQYDACRLLAETIIVTNSTDAGVIADNLISISETYYGLSGCLALDENGDRLPQLYDIKGFYEDPDPPYEYEEGTFGSYNGTAVEVIWDDDFLEYTGITRPGK